LALKNLGLPLKEIARMLDQGVSAGEIREIMEQEQAKLQEQIREAQGRLSNVNGYLQQIENEGKMPDFEVLLKTVEAQWITSLQTKIPWSDRTPWDRQ
jgi:DNA-binding transcriptional MerR regulator